MTNAEQRRETVSSKESYLWTFPGAPVQVEVSLEVIRGISAQILKQQLVSSAAETKGLLTGTLLGRGRPVIESFRDCSLGDSDTERARADVEVTGQRVLGFYRVQHAGPLRLSPEDVKLAQTSFRDPDSVALLVTCDDLVCPTAGFFFWDSGSFTGEFCFLEFPFDAETLERKPLSEDAKEAEHSRPPTPVFREQSATTYHPASASQRVPLASPSVASKNPARIGTAAFIAAVAVLVVVAAFLIPSARSWFPLKANVANPAPKPTSLGLHVQDSSNGLLVTWDRDSGIVPSATGTLQIEDGERRREVRLDAAQVANGSVLYLPATDDVLIRLQVVKAGTSISESLRILGATRHAITAVPAGTKTRDIGANAGTDKSLHSTTARATSPEDTASPHRTAEAALSLPNVPLPPGRQTVPHVPTDVAALPAPPSIGNVPTKSDPLLADLTSIMQASPITSHPYFVAQPLRRVMPDRSRIFGAGGIFKASDIRVEVRISETGQVVEAKVSGTQSKRNDYVAGLVVAAAKQWLFEPARINGKAIPSDQLITFRLLPDRH